MKRLSIWTLLLPLLVLTSPDAWADTPNTDDAPAPEANERVPEPSEQAPNDDASAPAAEELVEDQPDAKALGDEQAEHSPIQIDSFTVDSFTVKAPKHGTGRKLSLKWDNVEFPNFTFDDASRLFFQWITVEPNKDLVGLRVLRRSNDSKDWAPIGDLLPPETISLEDKLSKPGSWDYKLIGVYTPGKREYELTFTRLAQAWVGTQEVIQGVRLNSELFELLFQFPSLLEEETRRATTLGLSSDSVTGKTKAYFLIAKKAHMMLLGLVVLVGFLMMYYTRRAQRGEEIYIRRIPGIDAIEEGIGRSTEMGKPVLYVPGIDDLQDIQTIASMLILGQVSKTVAEYQSDLIVSCCIPIVREVADEVVRAGYYQAGHPDAFNAANVRFIASDQFAFCAGTNGIMLREKPSTNIYFGRFFAESLILAETGFVNRSIQIAGTAEATQLPFFIAACDYTLIGEELFAVSAYLSKDPRLVSSLKASDIIKVICVVALIAGTVLASMGDTFLIDLFKIRE